MHKLRPKNNSGFTLLEVMAAMAIIAISLIGVYQLYAQSIRLSGAANFYATASLLTQKVLGEIDTKIKDDIMDDSGDFGDEFPGYTYRVAAEDVMSEDDRKTSAKLKKIDIEIAFNEDESLYQLRTYRFIPERE